MAIDANRLRTEGVYESQAPLGSVTMDLEEIQQLAAAWRASRKRCLIAGIITVLVGAVLLAAFWPAGVLLIPIGIGCFFWRSRYNKGVADGAKQCTAARAVTDMLNHDTAAQRPVSIRLALGAAKEVVSEVTLANRRSGKQRLYKVSWFRVEARLLDGTTFSETIDDLVRERSFRNPRGKYKTKTRVRSIVSLCFAYPPDVYGNVSPLAERLQKEIHIPPSVVLKQFAAGERQVKVKALVTKAEELAQATPMLALGVYRMLNLSRRLAARARRSKGGGQ